MTDLYHNAVILAPFHYLFLLTKWVELDLVHGRQLKTRIGNLLEVVRITEREMRTGQKIAGPGMYICGPFENSQVTDANTPHKASVSRLQKSLPHRQAIFWSTVGIMDE